MHSLRITGKPSCIPGVMSSAAVAAGRCRPIKPMLIAPCGLQVFVPFPSRPGGRSFSRRLQANAAGLKKGISGEAEGSPWHIGFQCNERYLKWDDSAQRQLLRLTVADKLDIDTDEVNTRLSVLAQLLPDAVGKMERMRADILIDLVADPSAVATRLVALRDSLPASVDVSALVAMQPSLLLNGSPEDASASATRLREALGDDADIGALLRVEPMLLRADISAVLERLRRLLPSMDPVKFLLSNPRAALDMEEGGLPSSIDK